MGYIQVKLSFKPREVDPDMLTAMLTVWNFDSFEETAEGLIAYIAADDWKESTFLSWLDAHFDEKVCLDSCEPLEEKNWNEVWESNFPPVIIDERCRVRAPFHDPDPGCPLELVIEPKMSFGTAHHETTALMLLLMLDRDWKGQRVLDMGCGTGILAIAAAKLGAHMVMAIDNDPWAYDNAVENIERNKVAHSIAVKQGDAGTLSGSYDVILANINRNILLADMKAYISVLKEGGVLMMSGFYLDDLQQVRQQAASEGMAFHHHLVKNNWVAAVFVKSGQGK